MTDNEIIKALEEIKESETLKQCSSIPNVAKDALDLIKIQQAEIERLDTNCLSMAQTMPNMAKAERAKAIKEFVDKLKARIDKINFKYIRYCDVEEIEKLVVDIDNLVIKMRCGE